MANLLRSCAECSAHILVNDGLAEMVFCARCRPKEQKRADAWFASLGPGSRVYLQPVANPWPALAHSTFLVTARRGDEIDAHILGMPDYGVTVHVGLAASRDMTPRPRVHL